jgi:cytochrome d ubiquinol oxidase subunit II
MTLEILWYLVIGFAVIFYVILDGFDLGVGLLHLFVKKDEERRVFLNAIGPVWDGNEVWLVIVGGALFAGFPNVYATLFSAFYNSCMILLCGLIFRAVAIEFRSKEPSMKWRFFWDKVFAVASLIIALGIGFVLGNLVQGIDLDENGNFVGQFGDFFRPYSILIGIMTVALLMMHGSIFLAMKTEAELHQKVRRMINPCITFFLACYATTTIATLLFIPHMTLRLKQYPELLLIALVALGAILAVPPLVARKKDMQAFASSSLAIALLFILFGIGTYPVLVRSTIQPEQHSLTIFNSSSSQLTLKVLLIIVAIGIPLVLAYGFLVYRIFRGKVKIEPTSY